MSETVNLKKSYSALNEAITKLYDESGVRRSFTVPYIESQPMADHVTAVGQAASQNGGLTGNLVMSAHHSDGKGPGSGDGHTVGHSAEKLRQTLIPKNDERAKAAINAAQTYLNHLKVLLGDDEDTIKTAQGHLNLVKPTSGSGMSLFDMGVLLINIMHAPTQKMGQKHSESKHGGEIHARRTGPAQEESQGGGQEAPGEAPEAGAGSEAQAAPEAQGAAPTAPGQAQG
jgi:hypothetical protein